MPVVLSNNATSLLAAAINAADVTLSIANDDAGKFPNPAAGEWFPLTIVDNAGNMEIVKASDRVGAIITVERAQEGTSAIAFAAGARVDLRATAAALYDVGEKATTKTVGQAIAGANGKETPEDGDFFAGVAAGGSTMFKTTWVNIKTALAAIFPRLTANNNFTGLNDFKTQLQIKGDGVTLLKLSNAAGNGAASFYVETTTNYVTIETYTFAGAIWNSFKINGGGYNAFLMNGAVAWNQGNLPGGSGADLSGSTEDYKTFSGKILESRIQAVAQAWVANRPVFQNCAHNSGIVEFGPIDVGYNNITADLPTPYVVTGLRSRSGSNQVFLRGTIIANYGG